MNLCTGNWILFKRRGVQVRKIVNLDTGRNEDQTNSASRYDVTVVTRWRRVGDDFTPSETVRIPFNTDDAPRVSVLETVRTADGFCIAAPTDAFAGLPSSMFTHTRGDDVREGTQRETMRLTGGEWTTGEPVNAVGVGWPIEL